MLSPLRNRFGIPGVISVIALVFAMFGGAYAASNSSDGGQATASAKGKQGPPGKRGRPGPAGPAGPQGPAGPAGAKGDTGAKGDKGDPGANGANGTNGTSATVASFAGTKGTCTEGQGGLEVKSASPAAFVCNGKNGTTGFTDTLPSGKTETGTWSVTAENGGAYFEEVSIDTISFNIPLQANLGAGKLILAPGVGNATCTGTTASPTAPLGTLCVYEAINEGMSEGEVSDFFGASKVGAVVSYNRTGEDLKGFAGGTWAVTAP